MTQARHVSTEQLRQFFRPRSIALVGATDNFHWSLFTYQNLKFYLPRRTVPGQSQSPDGTRRTATSDNPFLIGINKSGWYINPALRRAG